MQVAQVDFTANNAAQDFCRSLKETGFAVIANHPINYAVVQDVFAEWAEFFASSYKNNYLYNNETQEGLFPMRSESAVGYSIKDLKEFYHYYPWGRYPKELSDKTMQLRKQMMNVAVTLLKWVEMHLPKTLQEKLSKPLSQMVDDDRALMRIIHYPPLTGDEEPGAVRASAHTDINLLTILATASQAGLQVKDVHGKWHNVPMDPGVLTVNVADMLQEATGGFYPSTIHQVVNPATSKEQAKSRYAIPLFLHAGLDTVLSERYTAGEFLSERLRDIGIQK